MDSTTSGPAPRPTHLFYSDFWSRLKVGTVLMTDDCHLFVIREMTADGVISRECNNPRRLWTWNDLVECTFSSESAADVGLYLRERGGEIDFCSPPAMEEWEGLIDHAGIDSDKLLDQALAAELVRLVKGRYQSMTLEIYAWKWEGKRDRFNFALERGWWWLAFRKERLRHVAWCQHQYAAARQPRPWSRMTFQLWHTEKGWRYDATFGYA